MKFFPLSEKEITQIKQKLSPLPIYGKAWSVWVCRFAWLMVFVIAFFMGLIMNEKGWHNSMTEWMIAFVFLSMFIMVIYMHYSHTEINQIGIKQSWLGKREVKWEEVTFAKFVPMIASKRLIIFIKQGRPITFQGSTPELQKAFANIALAFKNRQFD